MPVIIISGEEDEKTKKKARDAGANDFIAKSADAPEVLGAHRQPPAPRAGEAGSRGEPPGGRADRHPRPAHRYLHAALPATQGNKVYSQARRHGGPLRWSASASTPSARSSTRSAGKWPTSCSRASRGQ